MSSPTPDPIDLLPPLILPAGGDYIEREQLVAFATSVRDYAVAAIQAARDAVVIPPDVQAVIDALYAPGVNDLGRKLGDGVATTFTFTHSLGTSLFATEVYSRLPGPVRDKVAPLVLRPDDNTVRVDFGDYVPAQDEFQLVLVPRGVVNTTTAGAASQEYVDARVEARLRSSQLLNSFLFGTI